MTHIIWTNDYTTSNNTERLPPFALVDLQNDMASKVSGGLTDSNFVSTAAIVESKIAYDNTVGHSHDGLNSRNLSGVNPIVLNKPHLRSGMGIIKKDDNTITIQQGYVAVGSAILRTTSSTDITLSGSGNFVTGSESASSVVFVYVRNDGTDSSPSVTFKLSTESPDLGNVDAGTAEFPLRYQSYSGVIHRCIGAIFNDSSSNLLSGSETGFDISTGMTGFIKGDGSDQTITTIWTPTWIQTFFIKDANPSANDATDMSGNSADLLPLTAHYLSSSAPAYNILFRTADSTNGVVKTITAQTTSAAGSFVLDSPTISQRVYFHAWYNGERGA